MKGLVAVLTDFGLKDGFVGAMKGVILSINPEVQIVDISHEVEPFNILHGALLLKAHFSYFPKGTVFLCVVDPGVGSERLPIVVTAGGYTFVGPYNGLFDLVLRDIKEVPKTYEIEKFTLPRINETFHGRDVFAPVAGWLSKGINPQDVGRHIDYKFKLLWEEPEDRGDIVVGKIVYFDQFGNGITNIPCKRYEEGYFRGEKLRVVSYFLEAERNKPAFVCGSFGLMEIFLPLDNFRERFNVKIGEKVDLKKIQL